MNFNFNEEVLCGFTVTEKRKRLWFEEIKLVEVFINICKKHNLKYIAEGGTLLGAIRHNGFIPWDDDIDLAMPRDDYDKFITIAKDELPDGLFLQHYNTEKKYPNGHIQIRNSNTTFFIKTSYNDLRSGKNCGIFIDIFPLDNLPDDYSKRQKHAKKIKLIRALAFHKLYKETKGIKGIIYSCLANLYFLFNGFEKSIGKMDKLGMKYHNKTNTIGYATFMPTNEKNIFPSNIIDAIEYHQFNNIEIAIPKKYDEYLKTQFGNYMEIPEDKNGSVHGLAYFDINKSYIEYKNIKQEEFDALFKNNTY